MTNVGQVFLRAKQWISAHPRMLLVAIPLFFLAQFAFEVVSIFSSVPSLPNGPLQMVGTSFDGARFVVVDDQGRPRGGNTITILVVMREPLHNEHGIVRFAVKREFLDCANRQVQLHGAGFYDDQGRQSISRVYDDPPRALDSLDTEADLVCDGSIFATPPVRGYRAALAQTLELPSHK
jgi:hypothetical protein